jgi:hypothetical protein
MSLTYTHFTRRGEQIEDGDIALPLTESGTFVRLGMGRDGGPNLDAFMLQLEDQNLSPMPHTPPRPVKPLRINQNNQQGKSLTRENVWVPDKYGFRS